MALLIYDIGIRGYKLLLHIGALFNQKAKAFIQGRKNWKEELLKVTSAKTSWIWFHCASLGEFEQARPLIEAIKTKYPQYKILLSFFSPSGYSICKNYEHADAVMYMPLDTKVNAAFFVNTLKPILAVFVKYEFWYHHLNELRKNRIDTLLISAAFRKDQHFFKWYGNFFRKMLHCFTTIFVQDKDSAHLLEKTGFKENVFISGDTRYDRVAEIAATTSGIPPVEYFLNGADVFIAGSTWEKDEQIIHDSLDAIPSNWKIIIAPHEIHKARLEYLQKLFDNKMILFSQIDSSKPAGGKKVLVIDNIGMLSSLYAYGRIAYVGGGFQKGGIHNVLEPAVFGLPVIFGTHYEKFIEAVKLKQNGFAYSISDSEELKSTIDELLNNNDKLLQLKNSLSEYMRSKAGATTTIMQHIGKYIHSV